jgi:putative oxidoreductase
LTKALAFSEIAAVDAHCDIEVPGQRGLRKRRLIVLSRILGSMVEGAYALLRIVAGLMFAFHGAQKIFGLMADSPQPDIGSQMWIGGIIELVCGVAVAFGAFTTYAAFLASGTMAVAYIQFHWKFQMGPQFFPTVNKGELALLYSLVFFYIACRGGGKTSFDRQRAPR